MISIAKPLDRFSSTYQRSGFIETGVAGGIAKPLLELELEDEDELLAEELEDALLELLDDELLDELDDALLDEVPPDSCPPHAPIMAARAAAPRILRDFIMSTLLVFYSIFWGASAAAVMDDFITGRGVLRHFLLPCRVSRAAKRKRFLSSCCPCSCIFYLV